MPEDDQSTDGDDRSADGDCARADDARLLIAVVRSGGIAGMLRRWQVEPPPDETRRWSALIDRCPWDAPAATAPEAGADRFVWRVHARTANDDRQRELRDSELTGPWQELVEAVRASSAPSSER